MRRLIQAETYETLKKVSESTEQAGEPCSTRIREAVVGGSGHWATSNARQDRLIMDRHKHSELRGT
jgi:hypothetical protein